MSGNGYRPHVGCVAVRPTEEHQHPEVFVLSGQSDDAGECQEVDVP